MYYNIYFIFLVVYYEVITYLLIAIHGTPNVQENYSIGFHLKRKYLMRLYICFYLVDN